MSTESASPPFISFLSDYGLADDFVGVCHGVIASICPPARVVDLTHGVPRHDVRAGALILAGALGFLPVGVHLAVVDPDVGAERRAVAIRLVDDRLLVGPDNGVLTLAAERGGGIIEAVDIARSPFRLEPVSATFHGRDIFAPVSAHLAAGAPLPTAGDPIDPAELIRLEFQSPRHEDGAVVAHVRYVDRFGNLQLDAGHDDVADSGLRLGRPTELELEAGVRHRVHYARTFSDADPGELLLYEDAQRRLAVAVSHGDAAARLGLGVGDELRIRPA
jgi:S-adenosyl-L-methionine hydrolase (adenosine-forming)